MDAIEYLSEIYRGYSINWHYDECPDDPRSWDNPDHMICWHRRYNMGDKHDFAEPINLFRFLVQEEVPREKILEYIKANKICEVVENPEADEDERFEMCVHYEDYYGENTEVLYGCATEQEVWNDIDTDTIVDEYFDHSNCKSILEDYVFIRPISMYEHSGCTVYYGSPCDRWDSGYIGYGYMTKKEVIKGWGESYAETWKEQAKSIMDGSMEVYDSYVRGDVYGFVIEDEDGDEVDSCWGFYGDEAVKEQTKECKDIIDAEIVDRERKAKEEAERIEREAIEASCEFWSCIA